jgi:hypothetical protein
MEKSGESPIPEIWQRIGLVLGTLAFCLVLIEIPAMINVMDYSRILGVNADWLQRKWIADPELVHINEPRVHFSGSAKGGYSLLFYRIPDSGLTRFHWDITRDSNGFRNATDLKSADIVVIGDSFVEGMTVPYEQIMTSILMRLRRRVVANLGQPGYGPQQELIVLKRYGLPLKPKTVVWTFYEGNDLTDVQQYERYMHQAAGGSFWSSFWGRSFTQSFLKRVQHFILPSAVKASGVVHTSDGRTTTYVFDNLSAFSAKPLGPESLKALDVTRNSLEEARDICAAQGCRLVVVFIPTAFRVMQPVCSFPEESICRNWVPNDLPERFRNLVQSLSGGIGYLDLTPVLKAAVKTGSAPYYPDDSHWAADGHALAAKAINEYLVSRGDD